MLMTSLTPSKSTRRTWLELKAANNNSVAHLDQDLCQCDTELEGLAHRIVAHEDDAEETSQHSSASRHTVLRLSGPSAKVRLGGGSLDHLMEAKR